MHHIYFLPVVIMEGLLPTNRRFAAMLQARHFSYEFHTVSGGHDWNQWNRNVPALMKSVMDHLKLD